MRAVCGVVLLALASCSVEEEEVTREEVSSIAVDAVQVERLGVERTLEALGTLEAHQRVSVSPEIDGILQSIHFLEGDRVPRQEGERPILFELESRLLQLEVANAKAQLAVIEADLDQKRAIFKRKEMMHREMATTEAAYTDAKLELQSAQAARARGRVALEIAEERLKKATIRAPILGILGERTASPGDYVRRGEGLVEIVDSDPIEVSFSIPERFQSELKTDLGVLMKTDAAPGMEFKGVVFYVAPDVHPRTRTIRLKARLPNPEGKLKPGLFSKVTVVLGAPVESILVPEEAIVPRGEKFLVYIVDGDKARAIEVRLGQRLPGKVVILEGLEGSETVITAGFHQVSDGLLVHVREET